VAKQWEVLTGRDRETDTGVVQLIFSGEPGRPDYLRLEADDARALGMELLQAAAYAKVAGSDKLPATGEDAGAEPASDGGNS
jgi:hypothetical protein